MSAEVQQERRSLFRAVTVGHLGIDVFNSMVPVLVTFLRTPMGLSAAQVGLAIGLHQFLAGATQPAFGWLADRVGSRVLGPLSVAVAIGFLGAAAGIGPSGGFGLLALLLGIAALGSGAFHPQGVFHAARAVVGREATSTSYFFLAGQFGLALGPMVAGLTLDFAGPRALLVISLVFGSTLSLWMAGRMSRRRHEVNAPLRRGRAEVPAADPRGSRRPGIAGAAVIAGLSVVFALRGWLFIGTAAFLPLVVAQSGGSASIAGLVVGLFWMGGAIGGVVAGRLADRLERRRVVAATTALGGALLPLLAFGMSWQTLAIWALGTGALLGAPHSVLMVMAQDHLPVSGGLASGLALGFLFASGAVSSWCIGWLADRGDLIDVLSSGWIAAAAVTVLVLCLPSRRRGPRWSSADVAQEVS